MTPSHLGIDVSKAKLDCALRLPSGKFRAKVIANSLEGFAALLAWLDTQQAGQPDPDKPKQEADKAKGFNWNPNFNKEDLF